VHDLDLVEASKASCRVGLLSLQVSETSRDSNNGVGNCVISGRRLRDLFHLGEELGCQINCTVRHLVTHVVNDDSWLIATACDDCVGEAFDDLFELGVVHLLAEEPLDVVHGVLWIPVRT